MAGSGPIAGRIPGMNDLPLFTLLDLTGTFVFAISGALAAREKNLDLFGIVAVAYCVACGGGVMRDLCIGAIPPAGLHDWRYLVAVILAASLAIAAYPQVRRLAQPVLLFDALGLSFFAVFGAHKALLYGHNLQVATILGVISAVGGGVVRDVLLNRVPLILTKEIYASAAIAGALFQASGEGLGWSMVWTPWIAIALCFSLRYLSLHYHWNLPQFPRREPAQAPERQDPDQTPP